MNFLSTLPWGQILLFLHTLLVLACAVRVLYQQRNTGTAFAWLIILFVFPYLARDCLLYFGRTPFRHGARPAYRPNEPILWQIC